ncbi:hypothetical protein B0H13DRAFT_2313367 [Mycena leptocephala]|nr:hypothetical protein B0H13DRAFT_2313367 [Mycena leptocephala]
MGAENPDTLTSMANLASTYWNQDRWKDAEALQVVVLETRKRVLGEEHPSTLTSMANLASTYWNQGRHLQVMQWCPALSRLFCPPYNMCLLRGIFLDVYTTLGR